MPDSGALTIDVLNTTVSFGGGAPESLLDDNGSALVVHVDPGDYRPAMRATGSRAE